MSAYGPPRVPCSYSRSYRQKTELEPWLIDPMRELGVMAYFKRAVEVFAEKYAEK